MQTNINRSEPVTVKEIIAAVKAKLPPDSTVCFTADIWDAPGLKGTAFKIWDGKDSHSGKTPLGAYAAFCAAYDPSTGPTTEAAIAEMAAVGATEGRE